MSCFSPYFEFFSGESKKLQTQINVVNTSDDCKEPIGLVSPVVAAALVIQDLTLTALSKLGDSANLIKIEYVTGGSAGLETVSLSGTLLYVGAGKFIGSKITVMIAAGISTAIQIKAALDANTDVALLLATTISGVGSNVQALQAPTALIGGSGSYIEVEVSAVPDDLYFDLSSSPVVVVNDAALSKISVDLTANETSLMADGPLIVRVMKAGKLTVAVAGNGIKQLFVPNC